MARGGISKPIGYETIWKDRKGRTRVKVKVEEGKRFVDKRIVVWKQYHPEDDLKGFCIIHLDNDPLNFDINNLAKVKKEIFLLMLNNKIYFNIPELNKTSILIATNMYESKKKYDRQVNSGKQEIRRNINPTR